MDAFKYAEIETEIIRVALDTARRKRPAYTGADADVLHNFKEAAKSAGITPGQAWIVLAKKHWDAIVSLAKDKNIPQAEPPIGRAGDLINYTILLIALAADAGDIILELDRVASPESKEGRSSSAPSERPFMGPSGMVRCPDGTAVAISGGDLSYYDVLYSTAKYYQRLKENHPEWYPQ